MAAKGAIRPLTVPSSPISVAMFASDHRAPMRFSACGFSSESFSLSAASISSGLLLACVSPDFTNWRIGKSLASHSLMARSMLPAVTSFFTWAKNSLEFTRYRVIWKMNLSTTIVRTIAEQMRFKTMKVGLCLKASTNWLEAPDAARTKSCIPEPLESSSHGRSPPR